MSRGAPRAAAAPEPVYERIGSGYAGTRREDPRIAAAIHAALGPATTIVNVGAGAGSYEPRDRWVLAVEPSRAMIAQRPPGAAPVVVAGAERLPLADATVDAAMAILTTHHWTDRDAGLRELRRVARHTVVVLTFDVRVGRDFWLLRDYVPEVGELDLPRFPAPERFADALGPVEVRPVPIPADCVDGFLGAFWARPEAYLDPVVRAGMSAFRQVDPAAADRAVAALARDLADGTWDARHGDLRDRDAIDLGYRLVVARLDGDRHGGAAPDADG